MINEELLKKAKELGISDEEIATFIKNEKDAEKYGFTDDCASINVKIDNSINPDEEEEPTHHCDNCCEHHCDDKEDCCCCSHDHGHEHSHN